MYVHVFSGFCSSLEVANASQSLGGSECVAAAAAITAAIAAAIAADAVGLQTSAPQILQPGSILTRETESWRLEAICVKPDQTPASAARPGLDPTTRGVFVLSFLWQIFFSFPP